MPRETLRINLKKNGVNTNKTKGNYDNRKYYVNDFYFSNIDTEFKAYMIGFIMADGYISKTNNILTICIHKKDKLLLEKFIKEINTNYKICNHKDRYVKLTISSKQIVNDLYELGLIQNKTKVLKCPNIKEDLMHHLIRGYFDGDGSIWYDKNSNSYRVQFIGTKQVLQTFQYFFKNYNKLNPTSEENVIFRYGFSGNINVYNNLNKLYENSTIYLSRKYEIFLKCKELKEYNEQNKKQIWVNNLGHYASSKESRA